MLTAPAMKQPSITERNGSDAGTGSQPLISENCTGRTAALRGQLIDFASRLGTHKRRRLCIYASAQTSQAKRTRTEQRVNESIIEDHGEADRLGDEQSHRQRDVLASEDLEAEILHLVTASQCPCARIS